MTMQSGCRAFVNRIVKDFQHKELLPLKLLFFVHASTIYVLYPYLTIHMRELGINVEETAIMSAVTPVLAIVMPPLAGMVADKIGNFKALLSFFSCFGGAISLLLLAVPIGRITVTYPEDTFFAIGCANYNFSDYVLNAQLGQDLPCNRTNSTNRDDFSLTTTLQSCGFVCVPQHNTEIPQEFQSASSEEVDGELSVDAILKARSYQIQLTHPDTKESELLQYNLTQADVHKRHTKQQALSNRFMSNNDNWATGIRRLSADEYFLPLADGYGYTCSQPDEASSETSDFLLPSASRFSRMRRSAENAYSCRLGEVSGEDENNSTITLPRGVPMTTKFHKLFNGDFTVDTMHWASGNLAPSCNHQEWYAQAKVFLHNPENNLEILHEVDLHLCEPKCLLTVKRAEVCSNLQKEITYNPALTFWVYMVVRVFIGIIGGTSFAMFEGAVIAILREQKADYGLQRIYASVGGMISSPLSGFLIDYASQGKGYTDFRPAFYLYAALKVIGGILMLTINLEFKTAAKNVVSDVVAVLKKIEIIGLLVTSFILGTSLGYIESFLFWLLQDLGGTRSLMGITITVGGIAGIPLLAMSGPIIDKIGHANVIFIGFVFYAVRLLGYSLIYNPWHCLFFEAMESITTGLSFTAAVTYAAKLSTSTTDSSIQGLLGGLYFGVGKGAGSFAGGYLMNVFGTRATFQIFAVFTAFMGCIYYFFNRFYISKLPATETNDICKKEPKMAAMTITPMNEKPTERNNQAHDNPNFDNQLQDEPTRPSSDSRPEEDEQKPSTQYGTT